LEIEIQNLHVSDDPVEFRTQPPQINNLVLFARWKTAASAPRQTVKDLRIPKSLLGEIYVRAPTEQPQERKHGQLVYFIVGGRRTVVGRPQEVTHDVFAEALAQNIDVGRWPRKMHFLINAHHAQRSGAEVRDVEKADCRVGFVERASQFEHIGKRA